VNKVMAFLCFIPRGLKVDIIEIVLKTDFSADRKLTENTPRTAVNVV